ncbi:MAG: HTH-type transcriptional repressor FabR [Lysobacteraceae bacterium]|nr:MAG: HTH-type transcriptional repressor FabR [Xanthomonadaceae bacterium]
MFTVIEPSFNSNPVSPWCAYTSRARPGDHPQEPRLPVSRSAPPRPDPDPPVSRTEQKERTRLRLVEAALSLIGQGRPFSALGLREVTREAGVVPAAFYRHFRDLDQLGLALVEMGGVTLRRLLREARRDGIPPTDMLRGSVLIYKRFVEDRPLVFRFIAGERGGGSRVIREAIRTEESHFASEMAQDLRAIGTLPDLSSASLQMICGLVVTTMLNAASDILDLPAGQPKREQELVANFVRQLRVIFLGAARWRER